MNKKLLVLAMSLALLMSAAASAQTIHLKVVVPFGFNAGNTMLPPGLYDIQSTGNGYKVLAIRSMNSTAAVVLISHSCESLHPTDRTRLVFHRYGQRYFLSQVWLQGNHIGHQLPPSPREVEVARDFSKDEVILVAKRN